MKSHSIVPSCSVTSRAGKIFKDFDWSLCGIPPVALPSCPLPSTQTEAPEQIQEGSPNRDQLATSCRSSRASDNGQKHPDESQHKEDHPKDLYARVKPPRFRRAEPISPSLMPKGLLDSKDRNAKEDQIAARSPMK